jgi:hypothetical protein
MIHPFAARVGRRSFLLLCCLTASSRADAQAPPPAADRGGPTGPVLVNPVLVNPVLVNMDSWIYDALDRVAALGYISDQASGLRPWTRQECIRQINEAQRALSATVAGGESESAAVTEGMRLIADLRKEFSGDGALSTYAELESLYGRYTEIGGKPLIDGYNFGQTIFNDYGRPNGQGGNSVSGFSAKVGVNRFSFYMRGEYEQSAPISSPASALLRRDSQIVPVVSGSAAGVSRFEPLEIYMGAQFGNFSLTAGKQDLWWGPEESGPLSFSANAQPFYSFRLTSTAPIRLPGPLRIFGSFRIDLIGGELSGHQFPARPLLNGQKLTWNPTHDLELGFTRWSLFGGAGTEPFTAGSLLRNLFANGTTGARNDPGDRKSGFDIRWRLPVPGRWVTLYGDFYADDEPSPLTNFSRSAFSPGVYLPRVPGLPRWDFRVEAPSTRTVDKDRGGEFFYWNTVFRDANTNQGNLLGSWVGRDGRGLLVVLSHWTTARSRLSFEYRQNRIGAAFLPGGGTVDEGSVTQSLQLGPALNIRGTVQFERCDIPILGSRRSDVLASVQMVYAPKLAARRYAAASARVPPQP